eukprot:1951369-Amphidinium_carterae.1
MAVIHSSDASLRHVVEFLVLDFCEAFWQIPIAHNEKKFFCTKVQAPPGGLLCHATGSSRLTVWPA